MKHSDREHSLRAVAVIAVLFGLLTWHPGGAAAMVFAVFAAHVWSGGAYELRADAAKSVRPAVWVGIARVGYRQLWRRA